MQLRSGAPGFIFYVHWYKKDILRMSLQGLSKGHGMDKNLNFNIQEKIREIQEFKTRVIKNIRPKLLREGV